MTTEKQVQLVMRDMLFVTWEVQPDVVRKLVDEQFDLDTRVDSNGREVGFVSAVCFRVADVRSSTLLLPSLSFEQVNYRAYVRAGEVPAVCFLDMKVNSRMVAALTSFMSVPIHYEDIDIKISPSGAGLLSYGVKSAGLLADVIVGEEDSDEGKIAPGFLTDRFVGFLRAGDSVFRIDVDQPGLATVPGRVQSVSAPRLEKLGVLTSDQSARPHSALYVREASFGANTPTRLR